MKPSGFTLMEIILALALVTVALGLLSVAVDIHLRMAGTSRTEVQQAWAARIVLQQIADDLRAAIPVAQGTSTIGGMTGNGQEVQVEISRMPLVDPSQPISANGDRSLESAPRADVRTVSYAIARPGDLPSVGTGPQRCGLVRRECERAAYAWALEQGDTAELDRALKVLAPEVERIEFTYFDQSGATYTQWDSLEDGGLPSAVRIVLSIRRAPRKAADPAAAETTEPGPLAVYETLVYLPNAEATLDRAVAETTEKPKSTSDDGQSSGSGNKDASPTGSGGSRP